MSCIASATSNPTVHSTPMSTYRPRLLVTDLASNN